LCQPEVKAHDDEDEDLSASEEGESFVHQSWNFLLSLKLTTMKMKI